MKRAPAFVRLPAILIIIGTIVGISIISIVAAMLLPVLSGCAKETPETSFQGVARASEQPAQQNTSTASGIIIDHTCLDLSRIPDQWLQAAKSNLKVHYAHTSHGGQITAGLQMLQAQNSKYACSIGSKRLPTAANALCIFDGQQKETYISPDLYWSTPSGRQATQSVLNHNPAINISMWSWCCQQTHNSEAETRGYLDAVAQMDAANPNVTFIYMTGNAQAWHGHHSYKSDKDGYNRYLRNEQIRAYCRANNKMLYDFADIESWYAGIHATSSYNGRTFPREHDHFNRNEKAHTSTENCLNKAKAFWWMMARMAGWNR